MTHKQTDLELQRSVVNFGLKIISHALRLGPVDIQTFSSENEQILLEK